MGCGNTMLYHYIILHYIILYYIILYYIILYYIILYYIILYYIILYYIILCYIKSNNHDMQSHLFTPKENPWMEQYDCDQHQVNFAPIQLRLMQYRYSFYWSRRFRSKSKCMGLAYIRATTVWNYRLTMKRAIFRKTVGTLCNTKHVSRSVNQCW